MSIEFVLGRSSVHAREHTDEEPDAEDLQTILSAAMTAPDHGGLKPWRMHVIRGDARRKLGRLFAEALQARKPSASAEDLRICADKPLRGSLIVAVSAKVVEHPKVPAQEQVIAAGCAAMAMVYAAEALGYGAVILSGPNMYAPGVREAFGLASADRMVGFVYIGRPKREQPRKRRAAVDDFVSEWKGA